MIVIGESIRKALFKDEDPMGKYIRLNNVPFKVVGVSYDKKRQNERTAYIPVTTAQRIFNGGDRVHSFTVTTKMVKTSAKPIRSLQEYGRKWHFVIILIRRINEPWVLLICWPNISAR